MLQNYFSLFFRNLIKYKTYSIINLSGLALGLVSCLFLILYLQHELSFDKFHQHADSIIRITEQTKTSSLVTETAHTYSALGPAIKNDFSDVIATTRFFNENTLVASSDEIKFQEPNFFYVDASLFDVFSFEIVSGNIKTALNEPFNLVVTSSMAMKYFGESNPINKLLKINDAHNFKVTAVVKDPPLQSHIQFDFLGSFSSLKNIQGGWMYNNWYYPPMYTYARLNTPLDKIKFENRLADLVEKHLGPGEKEQRILKVQKLLDIHTSSGYENELSDTLPMVYAIVLASIGLLILAIACINFLNLNSAIAMHRIKEFYLRRIIGAERKHLIRRYLFESLLLSVIAISLAFLFFLMLLPVFNNVSGSHFSLSTIDFTFPVTFLLCVPFIIGLLSSLHPLKLLIHSNSTLTNNSHLKIKNNSNSGVVLVVFQFMVTISLLIGTIVIHKQLNYLKDKNVGFQKEQLVVLPLRDGNDSKKYPRLKTRLKNNANIVEVSSSSRVPGKERLSDYNVMAEGMSDNQVFYVLNISFDFEETLGLTLLQGRNFAIDNPADSSGIIINESALEKLGWEDPIGRKLSIGSLGQDGNFQVLGTGNIIGVVQNFNYNSLHQKIDPMIMAIGPAYMNNYLSVRIKPTAIAETVSFIQKEWEAFAPNRTFEYFFLDESFNRLYQNEERLYKIFITFSALSIIIACLGLFAMASFMTKRRSKEISIRKISGATSKNIVGLLFKKFFVIGLFAIAIATPLSYIGLSNWLSNFAYRITIGLDSYVIGASICLVVMFTTVAHQSLRAAKANPVDSLRDD